MQETLLLTVEVATFLVVFMVIVAVSRSVAQRMAVEKRLSERKDQPTRQKSGLLKSIEIQNPFLAWVQTTTLDQDVKEKSELQKKLALAGYNSTGGVSQILCIGRAPDVTRNPIILGDAVPPTVIPLGVTTDAKRGAAFYARNFTSVNPHGPSSQGFAVLNITNVGL